MKKQIPVEFLYQLFALVTAVIVVHGMYVLVVRPKAEAIRQEQQILIETEENYVPERSVYVLIKDFEQEACFILMLWAMAIMVYKALAAGRERRLLSRDLVPLQEGMRSLDSRRRSRPAASALYTMIAIAHSIRMKQASCSKSLIST